MRNEQDHSKVLGFKDDFTYPMYKSRKQGGLDIAKYISQSSNMEILHLTLNNHEIEEEGVQEIGKAIQKLSKLHTIKLYLKWNGIGSESEVNQLALGIEANLKNLITLHLDLGDNNLGDFYSKTTLQAIVQCKNLKSLFIGLRNNFLDCSLSNYFKDFKNLKSLKDLSIDLSYNPLIIGFFSQITASVSEIQSLEALSMNLRSNNCKAKEISIICENISKLSHLKTLHLNFIENNIGHEGTQHLSASLSQLNNLENLNLELGWTKITESGFYSLLSNLSKCQSLKKLNLDLRWNLIGIKNTEIIDEEYINNKLEKLELLLRNNQLESAGLQKLIKYLSHFSSLKSVVLNSESNKIDTDLEQLGDCIAQNLLVPAVKLNLDDNDLNNETLISFITHMSKNKIIDNLTLILSKNQCDQNCYQQFGIQIAKFSNLKILFLDFEKETNNESLSQIRVMLKQMLKSRIAYFNFKTQLYPFQNEYKQTYGDIIKSPYLVKFIIQRK